ncbi:hypothetical protein Leryth_001249 [Lithospermum erythrorhizon]|nr:hypothetical protein Leryth_001249 [Lithospermum erythrorhizon]
MPTTKDVTSARLVFTTIENPLLDITLWNALIAAYSKNSMFSQAFQLFQKLVNFGSLKPDYYTYPSVLKACTGLGIERCGTLVHSHVLKNGLLADVVIASSIVHMYAKFGAIESALNLFDEISERDVPCWNTLVSGCCQSGNYDKALEMYEKMKELGYKPNSVTYTCVISSCAKLLDIERGEKIYQELVTNGYAWDHFVKTALVDLYGKCGCSDKAKEVFEQIPVKSLVCWNSMMAGYSSRGDIESCVLLLVRMIKEKVKPSPTTLSCLLMAASKSLQLQHGKFIHGYILRNFKETDIFVDSSLVDMYFKCNSVGTAERVFETMKKKNVIAWNVMISGYVSVGSYFEALDLFNDMKEAGIEPDSFACSSALAACSQLAALEQGKEIHKSINAYNMESNEIVMGALLDMYAKCGAVDEALVIFNKLPERDVISWTSMIVAFGSHGQASEAINLFRRMLQSNVKPDRVTFLAVLSACSHAGLVDVGCLFFNLMVNEHGIQPTVEDYSCLIDLLGRAGRLHEAYLTLQRTPCIRENIELLSTLFAACCMHGELNLAKEIGRCLLDKEKYIVDASTYVLLAKMYSSLGNWEENKKVRLKMKERGVRKYPGCSWIESNKRIQQFLAEDKLFSGAEKVYDCLSMMTIHMEKDEVMQDWG